MREEQLLPGASPAMIQRGIEVLQEHNYGSDMAELVDLIYSAMTYQSMRERAAATKDSR